MLTTNSRIAHFPHSQSDYADCVIELNDLASNLKAAPAPPLGDWVKPIVEAFAFSVAAGMFLRYVL